jgi:glycerol-3-phosphate O-acyltransferase/dihydroxyacetone phosphate acyltransferase
VIYSLLRAIAGVALRWYYADVTIIDSSADGGDWRSSVDGPLLVVTNHPNALVDVLVAARAVPRRLLVTAKATLFSNPVARALLSWLGVLPLRRASDEPGIADPDRNAQAFETITRALAKGRAILIFPEGKSHDQPAMAPLRTGVARLALHARDAGAVRGLRILPVGLVFERKEAPRSRVLAVVGQPLDVDSWRATSPPSAIAELTTEIDTRLRAVTLNYETAEEAARDARLATQIAALIRREPTSVATSGNLRDQTAVARLLPHTRAVLRAAVPEFAVRASAFQSELAALQQALDVHHISPDDLPISRDIGPGAVFALRESLILLVAGPLAIWGWLNHFIPFRIAIAAGKRVRGITADPAMRTIVAGTALVLMVYMIQGALVTLIFGPWRGIAYVLSLPMAADINLRLRDRLARSLRRARTYLLFRTHPQLQRDLGARAAALREEAIALASVASAR